MSRAQGWVRRALRGWIGLFVMIGAASCVPVVPPAPKVVVFGDSLMFETQNVLRLDLAARGVGDVTVNAYGGTAISDWLVAMQVAGSHSDARTLFVLEFGSNYYTAGVAPAVGSAATDADVVKHGYAALVQTYADDAARAEKLLTRKGARVLFVGGPAMPTRPWVLEVNDRFAALARSHPTTSSYVEAGLAVAPKRTFTESLGCAKSEPDCRDGRVIVRAPDRIHLCPAYGTAVRGLVGSCKVYSAGEVRFGAAIADVAAQLVGR